MKLSRAEYDATDGCNFSTLKHILTTPAHYQDALKAQEEKRADEDNEEAKEELVRYAVGTLTHARCLEGKDLLSLFAIKPKKDSTGRAMSFATTEGKEWKKAQTLPILTQAQADTAQFCSDAILKDPQARAIMERCKEREHAIITQFGNVKVKMLLDAYGTDDKGTPLVPDIKTSFDNSPEGFAKAVRDRDYEMQATWYTRGVSVRYGLPEETKPTFAWITVLNKRPFIVQTYFPSPRMWRRGNRKVNRALELLLQCRQSGNWPAYGGGLMELDYPAWDKEDL